jgi:purine-binding chemotaxis protein CheW
MNEMLQNGESKFVTFNLDAETYALPIGQVREVLEFTTVTKMPQTPPFVRGVINLRGNVLPVVDLRLKFGMKRTEKTLETRVIVVEVSVDGEATVLGALADSVKDVIDLPQAEIGPPPKIGTRLRTEFIKGIGRRDDDFIIILDIERVFTLEELSQVGELEGAAAPQDAPDATVSGPGPAGKPGDAAPVAPPQAPA